MSCFMIFSLEKCTILQFKYYWYQRQLLQNSKPKHCKSSFLDNSLFHPNCFYKIDEKIQIHSALQSSFLFEQTGKHEESKVKKVRDSVPEERETSEIRVETPSQNNETLTNVNLQSQKSLGEVELRPRLVEPSQVSNESQAWSVSFEQKNNDRIPKMREERRWRTS